MAQAAEKLQPWIAALEDRPNGGPRWLQDMRDRAAARFAAIGFPNARHEEWRFTNIAPISTREFRPATMARRATPSDVADAIYGDAPHRVVVVNGRFSKQLSRVGKLPAGVRIGSLAEAVTQDADVVQRYLGRLADFGDRSFTALNTALSPDGAFVHVPEGVILAEPVHLLFISTESMIPAERPHVEQSPAHAQATMAHPRALIVAGERSQSRIVESYAGTPGAVYFNNVVTELFAAEHAIVDHYRVQRESEEAFHVSSTHVHAAGRATVTSHSFSLGAKLVRNDVFAVLDGEGAECTLNGLYLADGERLVDNHTSIDHAKPHCPSHEIYKGILGGRARAVFNGKIIVRKDAQKTDAKQTNRALLLSDDATINTKPQLEIFADDVKCTHGAAIGQLDEDALFYLQARGLPFFEARDMLIHAFAGEILDRVQVAPLKEELERELFAQLARDLAEIDAA